jgi:hypothetical protein
MVKIGIIILAALSIITPGHAACPEDLDKVKVKKTSPACMSIGELEELRTVLKGGTTKDEALLIAASRRPEIASDCFYF